MCPKLHELILCQCWLVRARHIRRSHCRLTVPQGHLNTAIRIFLPSLPPSVRCIRLRIRARFFDLPRSLVPTLLAFDDSRLIPIWQPVDSITRPYNALQVVQVIGPSNLNLTPDNFLSRFSALWTASQGCAFAGVADLRRATASLKRAFVDPIFIFSLFILYCYINEDVLHVRPCAASESSAEAADLKRHKAFVSASEIDRSQLPPSPSVL